MRFSQWHFWQRLSRFPRETRLTSTAEHQAKADKLKGDAADKREAADKTYDSTEKIKLKVAADKAEQESNNEKAKADSADKQAKAAKADAAAKEAEAKEVRARPVKSATP